MGSPIYDYGQQQQMQILSAPSAIIKSPLLTASDKFLETLGESKPGKLPVLQLVPHLLAALLDGERRPFDHDRVKTMDGNDLMIVAFGDNRGAVWVSALQDAFLKNDQLSKDEAAKAAKELYLAAGLWMAKDKNYREVEVACQQPEERRTR